MSKIMRRLAEHALGQKKERGVGALIGIALRFLLLHLVEQPRQTRIVLVEDDAQSVELGDDVRRPA